MSSVGFVVAHRRGKAGSARLPKHNNPIRVRPLPHVVHAPAVRGLGELLVVDEPRGWCGKSVWHQMERACLIWEIPTKDLHEASLPTAPLWLGFVTMNSFEVRRAEMKFARLSVKETLNKAEFSIFSLN
jgi:hypothetical protein